MNRTSTRTGLLCLATVAVVAAWMMQSTAVAEHHESKALSPIRFNPAMLEGKGLTQRVHQVAKKRGNPRRILEEPSEEPRMHVFYQGDIVAAIYESKPAKFQLENTLYDEFVEILEGTLILTGADGQAHKFEVGDHLMVPKGWTGTWDMQGDVFREFIVIETKTMEEDSAAS